MIYEYSEQSDTHRCVLFSQISLFYQVQKQTKEVELLLFWDNRQDPENLRLGERAITMNIYHSF